jgi:hypothetical protein
MGVSGREDWIWESRGKLSKTPPAETEGKSLFCFEDQGFPKTKGKMQIK